MLRHPPVHKSHRISLLFLLLLTDFSLSPNFTSEMRTYIHTSFDWIYSKITRHCRQNITLCISPAKLWVGSLPFSPCAVVASSSGLSSVYGRIKFATKNINFRPNRPSKITLSALCTCKTVTIASREPFSPTHYNSYAATYTLQNYGEIFSRFLYWITFYRLWKCPFHFNPTPINRSLYWSLSIWAAGSENKH